MRGARVLACPASRQRALAAASAFIQRRHALVRRTRRDTSADARLAGGHPRFDDLLIRLDVLDPSHPLCQAATTMPVAVRGAVTPTAIDEAAVQRYLDLHTL